MIVAMVSSAQISFNHLLENRISGKVCQGKENQGKVGQMQGQQTYTEHATPVKMC